MDDARDAPAPRGHLHGRLLKVLGGVSAIAIAIALWQFGVFGDDPDSDPVGTVEGFAPPSIADGTEASSAPDLAQASSAAIDSPSVPTADETTAASSSEITLTPSSTAETEEASQEDATATECSASLTLTRAWEGGIEVSGTVVNTGGGTIGSWEVDLGLSGAEIYHHWDMRHLGGDQYTNEDWNGRIEPDGHAKFGFVANTDGDFELPDSVPCTAKA